MADSRYQRFRKKTAGMTKKAKAAYVVTYYGPLTLAVCFLLAVAVYLLSLTISGRKKAAYTCVIVNQQVNADWSAQLAEDLAAALDMSAERIAVDDDYIFSYEDVQMTGANESSYEKFFLKWRGAQLDAVIMPLSFYEHVKEMGGSFLALDKEAYGLDLHTDLAGLELYEDDGAPRAVILTLDKADMQSLTEETVVLAFPDNGKHTEAISTWTAILRG